MASASFVFLVSLWCFPGQQLTSAPFILETGDRDLVTGSLATLGDDWSVRLAGNEEVRAAGKDLIALRRVGAIMPPIPTRNFVLLANGDVIPTSEIRYDGERFELTPQLVESKEFRVSPSQVALVWFTVPDDERHPDHLRRALAAGQRARDRILFRNGDSLEGTLTGLDEKTVRLEAAKRKLELQRDKIAVIAMNTELTSRRKPKGPYARLVLTNGARLALATATADGETLSARLSAGAQVQVKFRTIVSLSIQQGRAVYLSDLKPSKIEQKPYLDATLLPVMDGSAKGRDLRVGGGSYDKGIGMHGACRMTFDLAGAYTRFESLVGLDDATGREGAVQLRVLVDGKPQKLELEGDLTHRKGPVPVRVDVTGAKQLTLVIDFGRRGDVQADVNWIDARLIKK
jgi:hypothetical protein